VTQGTTSEVPVLTPQKYLYIQYMNKGALPGELQKLRDHYRSGTTRPYAFRKEQLQKLKAAVLKHEKDLYAALYSDLKKSEEESWVTEIGFLVSEINATLKHLHHWMSPEKVSTNLVNLPSSSFIMNEPLGVVLIIGPWNYPLQLLFTPLVGAIAAGNCVVLKPSEYSTATTAVMKKIIVSIYPPEYILYVEGDGADVVPAMMNDFRFDHVFYTGSTMVGHMVYKMAAEKLVPITLELGGKSPCVIEDDANIKVAARRIAVTKFSNAGQMCVAPDYILVQEKVKNRFIEELRNCLSEFFTDEPENSASYGKIINAKQFDRLVSYLKEGKIVHGGRNNKDSLFIEPTIMEDVSHDSSLMRDEIFGPIVPIFGFTTAEEAKEIIENNPDPLAFYVFTASKKKEEWWLQHIPAGGACVNNASWHLTNHHLPFGGRGNSGIGRYHGKFSFDTFSHKKAVLKTPTWFDPDLKYPPFKGRLSLFKKIIR
jgi:aldehyde dehydrogenase (NAD+)